MDQDRLLVDLLTRKMLWMTGPCKRTVPLHVLSSSPRPGSCLFMDHAGSDRDRLFVTHLVLFIASKAPAWMWIPRGGSHPA
jgi:hypothetical protein